MKNIIISTYIFVGFWIIPVSLFSAQIYVDTTSTKVVEGEEFLVSFFIDSQNEKINALEGELSYSQDILEIIDIRSGNSVINFWLEDLKNTKGKSDTFSGIIPGGYQGEKGFIFSVLYRAKMQGIANITIENGKGLRNDENGTEIKTTSRLLILTVSKNSSAIAPVIPMMKENISPENFTVYRGQSQDIFDGNYFIVFATQDKGSGIDHYEVKEGFFGKYVEAKSPYLLKNQNRTSTLYIKALDKEGNERIEKLSAEIRPWYTSYWFLVLFLFGCVLLSKRYIRKK